MCRRIAAWLLAILLMIPLGASAAQKMDASWTADQEGIRLLLAQLQMDAQTQKELSGMAASLMNVLTLHGSIQEDGVQLGICLKCEDALNVSVQAQENDEWLLRTSLVPDIAMRISMDENLSSEGIGRFIGHLTQDLTPIFEGWLAGLSRTEEKGAFIGDAYEGGTESVLYRFDDAEIAALIDQAASLLGLREYVTSATHRAASANAYHYLLRLVRTNGRPSGLSLTVLNADDAQMATLSCSWFSENDTYDGRIVMGYGRDGHTWFDDYRVVGTVKEQTINLDLTCSEYTDDEAQGFRNVSALDENGVFSAVLGLNADWSENGIQVQTRGQTLIGEDGVIISAGDGSIGASDDAWISVDSRVYAGTEVKEAMGFQLKGTYCDPVALGTEHETVIGTEDIGSNLFQNALKKGVNDLMITLIRKLPAELLVLLFE